MVRKFNLKARLLSLAVLYIFVFLQMPWRATRTKMWFVWVT